MTAVVAANAVCVEAERLWDMVVVDVSEDMECESIRSGMSEAVMRDSVAGNLLRMGYCDVPMLISGFPSVASDGCAEQIRAMAIGRNNRADGDAIGPAAYVECGIRVTGRLAGLRGRLR